MSAIGILGQGTKLEVNNTIITKCGQYSVVCNIGGDYSFKHCTFALTFGILITEILPLSY